MLVSRRVFKSTFALQLSTPDQVTKANSVLASLHRCGLPYVGNFPRLVVSNLHYTDDTWSSGLVGLLDDPTSCCVHLLIVSVLVCFPSKCGNCFMCFLCFDSPTQCRVVYNVSNSLCNLFFHVRFYPCAIAPPRGDLWVSPPCISWFRSQTEFPKAEENTLALLKRATSQVTALIVGTRWHPSGEPRLELSVRSCPACRSKTACSNRSVERG